MEDKLFDTDNKRASATLQFKDLLNHQGWLLFVEVVKANIAVLRKQLEDGMEGETIDSVRHTRDMIKIHQEMIDTPQKLMDSFNKEEGTVPEHDPFA